jgi:hypothetical protein
MKINTINFLHLWSQFEDMWGFQIKNKQKEWDGQGITKPQIHVSYPSNGWYNFLILSLFPIQAIVLHIQKEIFTNVIENLERWRKWRDTTFSRMCLGWVIEITKWRSWIIEILHTKKHKQVLIWELFKQETNRNT